MANTRILYVEAEKRDLIQKFLLANPNYWLRPEDGKIDFQRRLSPDGPWIYVRHVPNLNCNLWHRILFDIIHGKQKVPIPCQSCWKVVLQPRTLEELFATYFMQLTIDRPCKCGTEGDRDNTNKLYGAYWYNRSREAGQECWEVVYDEIAKGITYERELLGCPVKVKFDLEGKGMPNLILKRGCTEFEQWCGPSDKWTYDAKQAETEAICNDIFVADVISPVPSEHMKAHTFVRWIHRAHQWGDETYKKFTNGNDLFAKVVTYHDPTRGGEKKEKKDGKKRS